MSKSEVGKVITVSKGPPPLYQVRLAHGEIVAVEQAKIQLARMSLLPRGARLRVTHNLGRVQSASTDLGETLGMQVLYDTQGERKVVLVRPVWKPVPPPVPDQTGAPFTPAKPARAVHRPPPFPVAAQSETIRDLLLSQPPELFVVDPQNPYIARKHINAAALALGGLSTADLVEFWGERGARRPGAD